MLDWLLSRRSWIERSLANRHLDGSILVLCVVASTYVKGDCCPLAEFGYNRDGKKGKKQIVFALLCADDGCPVAAEVFEGSPSDPATVARQVQSIRQRFGIDRLAVIGDRGLLTTARMRQDIEPA